MKIIAALFVLSFLSLGHAQTVRLGVPSMAGTGCPQGTARASIDPSGRAVSILFDVFTLNQSSSEQPQPTRDVSCTMIVPVSVDQGWNLDATMLTVRGHLFSTSPAAISYARVTSQLNNSGPWVVPPEAFGIKMGSGDRDVNIQGAVKPNPRAFCRPNRELRFSISAGYTFRQNAQGQYVGVAPFDFLAAIDSGDLGGSDVQINYQLTRCH